MVITESVLPELVLSFILLGLQLANAAKKYRLLR
jgi:hypothetical protein